MSLLSDIFTIGEFLAGTDTKTDKGKSGGKAQDSPFDISFDFGKSDKQQEFLQLDKGTDLLSILLQDQDLDVQRFIK